VESVAVTADGATAVSGGYTVRVWDLATGHQRAELTGHDGGVLSVAVTADGATVVSSGEDGTVRVWDLATRIELARWTGDFPVVACTVLKRPALQSRCRTRTRPTLPAGTARTAEHHLTSNLACGARRQAGRPGVPKARL
jgi:hypothetical protein